MARVKQDCNTETAIACHRININRNALGASSIRVRDMEGGSFVIPKKFGNLTPGSDYDSASYETFSPDYTTATLTWRNGQVSGSVVTPSRDPRGGEYRIANCGGSKPIRLFAHYLIINRI